MSTADRPSGDKGRLGGLRSRWVWAGAALVVAVVALVLGLTLGGPGTPSTGADATASPSGSPAPSSTADAPEPSESPTEPGGADPGEADPGEADPGATDPAEPGEVAEPGARPTAAPVPIDAPAEPEPQVEVQLTQIEAVEGVANIPGEVGGPSLRVTVSVRNATSSELVLTSAVVNLYHGSERSPAIELLEPGRRDLPASVAPGGEATGAFVFLVPVEARDEVVVEFDLSTESTVLLFSGAVS